MDRRLTHRLGVPLAALLTLALAPPAFAKAVDPDSVARNALERTPIFDGHNDLAVHFIRHNPEWSLEAMDLDRLPGQSSIAKWRAGHVGGALITTGSTLDPGAPGQFQSLLRSFDWFDALIRKHGREVAKVTTVTGLRRAWDQRKIGLVMAIEGGSQLDDSLGNFRTAFARGVRSVVIVYNDHNAIGDGSMPSPESSRAAAGGLTPFGRSVIAEMNRLGMIVDLSHAAETTARQSILASKAPILFSHSAARALTDTPRNLSDDTLHLAASHQALVMVPLVPYFVSEPYWRWWSAGEANYVRLQQLYPGDRARVSRESAAWDRDNPPPRVSAGDVADHIEHVAGIVGHDQIGIGSDFDGMGPHVIPSLADASRLPALFAELARRGWTQAQLEKLAGRNFERFFAAVEKGAEH